MKSLTRIKGKIGEMLRPCETGAWPQVRDRLNRLLGGWSACFGYGALTAAYRRVATASPAAGRLEWLRY